MLRSEVGQENDNFLNYTHNTTSKWPISQSWMKNVVDEMKIFLYDSKPSASNLLLAVTNECARPKMLLLVHK
jgi:hypothetical protein